ncbi:MAG TPA: MarR family winged helix-turn-helix transcriptional regulator [Gaiellaceae bacterium]|jgi:DNA-binding MarR family transcriptional regulator|nr:MarR family winged helix-turn-helix transcriptional regulator [Gaiellaceae bacterium]
MARDDLTPKALRELPSWLLGQTSVHAHRLLTGALSAEDARPYHFRVLASLQEFGPASQVEVGGHANLDRSDVVAAVDELEDRGFVERSADPVDRRRNVITITRAGRAHLRRLEKVLTRVQDELLSPLSPKQRRELIRLLNRLLEHHNDAAREIKPLGR